MTDHALISSAVAGFDRVTVRYGTLLAADAVTLDVPRGCVYTLLGRNGAGKSSLVRCLLGQQKPTGGRALLFGKDVWRTATERHAAPGCRARGAGRAARHDRDAGRGVLQPPLRALEWPWCRREAPPL